MSSALVAPYSRSSIRTITVPVNLHLRLSVDEHGYEQATLTLQPQFLAFIFRITTLRRLGYTQLQHERCRPWRGERGRFEMRS